MIRDTWDFAAAAVNHALGDEVIYNGVLVRAVYGDGFTAVQGGQTVRVSSTRPEIMVRLDELGCTPAEGDSVIVRDIEYVVATVRQDIEAVSATLALKRV